MRWAPMTPNVERATQTASTSNGKGTRVKRGQLWEFR
jgi:hypothetical protein